MKKLQRCTRCNLKGHEASDCVIDKVTSCQICQSPEHTAVFCPKIKCSTCQLFGHSTEHCTSGHTRLSFKTFESQTRYCSRCGKRGHEANACRQQYERRMHPAITDKVEKFCTYCKMTNHNVDSCFAKQREDKMKILCQWCLKPGHLAKQCFLLVPPEKNNQDSQARMQLYYEICNINGHTSIQCTRKASANKFCSFCKNRNHNIEEFIKRQAINEARANSGNGQRPQASGLGAPRQEICSVQSIKSQEKSESLNWV